MKTLQPKYIVLNNNEVVERLKVDEFDANRHGTCVDCGALEGEYHYIYCDIEACPMCGTQMYTCECWQEYEE